MSKRIVRFLICAALALALSVSAAAAEGSGLIGVCMQNMSSSISELEAEALRATFEPLGYEVQVVSADDEYMIGMYVAAVAKTWIEQNMDPDGDLLRGRHGRRV